MVNGPSRIRKRYSIKQGKKIVIIESENGAHELIHVPTLSELFGIDREHKDALNAAIRELEKEHRLEAAIDKKKSQW